jgi:hypothetical protein
MVTERGADRAGLRKQMQHPSVRRRAITLHKLPQQPGEQCPRCDALVCYGEAASLSGIVLALEVVRLLELAPRWVDHAWPPFGFRAASRVQAG